MDYTISVLMPLEYSSNANQFVNRFQAQPKQEKKIAQPYSIIKQNADWKLESSPKGQAIILNSNSKNIGLQLSYDRAQRQGFYPTNMKKEVQKAIEKTQIGKLRD